MFLHARGVIKRRLEAAKAEASKASSAIESATDQVGAAAQSAKRTMLEAAKADLHAAFDRFHALMRDLEADSSESAGIIVGELGEPFSAAGRALGEARAALEADASAARAAEHADDQAARDQLDLGARL